MAVSLAQLAGALRIGDGTTEPEEPQLAILTRLAAVAEALISVTAPAAPEPVRDEASIRIAAYLYDAPTSAGSDLYAAAVVNSGAGGLLSRWTVRRAVTGGELAPQASVGTVALPGIALTKKTVVLQVTKRTVLAEIPALAIDHTAWATLRYENEFVGIPGTGDVEIFVLGVSGNRDDSVSFAVIPASILRAATAAGQEQVKLALGANRELEVRSSGATNYLQMKGQAGQTSVVGNYFVRVVHLKEGRITVLKDVGIV